MEFIWDIFGKMGISESVFQFMLVNMLLALSIYITLYSGMFSLANAGFMAIGAYVGVIATQTYALPLWVGLITGMAGAGLAAWLLGLPVLRLHDIYLAIATIGFSEIVRIIILNFDSIISSIAGSRIVLTGGALGIKGIPKITQTWHLVFFLILVILVLQRLEKSRFGRSMRAIRDDEDIAAGSGINIVRIKTAVFILGAMLAGAAGVFSGHLTRIISPGVFNFVRVVDILAYAVLGGTTTLAGPVVGAGILTLLPELARPLKAYNQIVNGIIMVLVIIFLPQGVMDPKVWQEFIFKSNRKAP
jgi:branched-chain amino acid transport system permease protein